MSNQCYVTNYYGVNVMYHYPNCLCYDSEPTLADQYYESGQSSTRLSLEDIWKDTINFIEKIPVKQ